MLPLSKTQKFEAALLREWTGRHYPKWLEDPTSPVFLAAVECYIEPHPAATEPTPASHRLLRDAVAARLGRPSMEIDPGILTDFFRHMHLYTVRDMRQRMAGRLCVDLGSPWLDLKEVADQVIKAGVRVLKVNMGLYYEEDRREAQQILMGLKRAYPDVLIWEDANLCDTPEIMRAKAEKIQGYADLVSVMAFYPPDLELMGDVLPVIAVRNLPSWSKAAYLPHTPHTAALAHEAVGVVDANIRDLMARGVSPHASDSDLIVCSGVCFGEAAPKGQKHIPFAGFKPADVARTLFVVGTEITEAPDPGAVAASIIAAIAAAQE